MTDTMNAVKPPRITALRDLHDAETGPFSILIGTILSARTKDETTTKAVKALFKKYKNPKDLANAKVKDVEKIITKYGSLFWHYTSEKKVTNKNDKSGAIPCSDFDEEPYLYSHHYPEIYVGCEYIEWSVF